MVKANLGPVDLVIYSHWPPRAASIRRAGAVHKSVLKPVGAPYTNKTVDTDKGIVSSITIEPASEQEIADTVTVMGGEDWEMWMAALPKTRGFWRPASSRSLIRTSDRKSLGRFTRTARLAWPRTIWSARPRRSTRS